MPGDPEHKALLLGAIEAMPEASKVACLALVSAGEKAMQSTFSAIGHGPHDDGDGASAGEKLSALYAKYQKDNGGTIAQATVAVMATPEGKELYEAAVKER